MFHTLNIVNIVFYIIVIGLMIGSLATGADEITQFQNKVDSDNDDYIISTVLLLSSFYSVIIIFSILCVVVLSLSGKVGIHKNKSFQNSYLLFNSIILAMSLLVMLPTVGATYQTEVDVFTGLLLIGSILSILLSIINIGIIIHNLNLNGNIDNIKDIKDMKDMKDNMNNMKDMNNMNNNMSNSNNVNIM